MSSPAVVLSNEAFEHLTALRAALDSSLEGKPAVVELTLVALLARGHILIEDVPGVGKTTLARALAKTVAGQICRVQCTSDLLPGDVLGVSIFDHRQNDFTFRPGPIFTNVLLADEINRATPRTQSALLEAMSDRQVSVDGRTIPLPDPFLVVATQNPRDSAGTFPLPESQLDRFMLRLSIGYPASSVETRLMLNPQTDHVLNVPEVIDSSTLCQLQRTVDRVTIDGALGAYLQAIVTATRNSPALSLGASTRAGMNLAHAARARAMINGRNYCIADDVHDLVVPLLAHRVRLTAQTDGFVVSSEEAETTVREITSRIPIPL